MNWHKCLWKRNIRLEGSHPDRALCGNSPVLKSVLSLAEVEQLIEHSHPGGKFRRRKASFTLRNSYYCDKVAELIGWAAIAVFFLPSCRRIGPSRARCRWTRLWPCISVCTLFLMHVSVKQDLNTGHSQGEDAALIAESLQLEMHWVLPSCLLWRHDHIIAGLYQRTLVSSCVWLRLLSTEMRKRHVVATRSLLLIC